ncbi:MAG: iron-containing alcohol dehydrogenase, partial [Lentisphaeria bacterium]|nr:iron-containing alcohol dehydrogenase [Lentisphaeria bacterium]NQZ70818.1 iron-containing alcohol dehydrogenase [Lentisphaeria bacterium]
MSNQFNFPTVIISGENALAAFADALKKTGHKHMLIVTDTMLVKLGICQQVLDALKDTGIQFTVFDGAEPNPVEANVEAGAEAYTEAGC